MKTLLVMMVVSLLAACASGSLQHPTAKGTIQFEGAKNDISSSSRPDIEMKNQLLAKESTPTKVIFPLSYAVQCDTTKLACKHGIVKTELQYSINIIDSRSLRIKGVLHSEIGRSKTIDTLPSPAYSQALTRKVSDSVSAIDDSTNEQSFNEILQLGEKLNLEGYSGVKITLQFNEF